MIVDSSSPSRPSTPPPQGLCTCSACCLEHSFSHPITWFFPSFPPGIFSHVALPERPSLAIQYKTAVPWPQDQHPLPVPLLHCVSLHPTCPVLTCVTSLHVLHGSRNLVLSALSGSENRACPTVSRSHFVNPAQPWLVAESLPPAGVTLAPS